MTLGIRELKQTQRQREGHLYFQMTPQSFKLLFNYSCLFNLPNVAELSRRYPRPIP